MKMVIQKGGVYAGSGAPRALQIGLVCEASQPRKGLGWSQLQKTMQRGQQALGPSNLCSERAPALPGLAHAPGTVSHH